jgi:hypothetical protein
MATTKHRSDGSWFRTRGGRRFGREFAWIIIGKLILLGLLWFFVVSPHPRIDTTPAAVELHFSKPLRTDASP